MGEPDPRLRGVGKSPIFERGRYWCPECDGALVDPQDSGEVWHHWFGERGDCEWTD